MKKGNILRTLSVAFILALLIAVIPAAPALAAPEIDLNPEEGEIGDEIRLSGDGFSDNTTVYIYFSSDDADVGDYIDDEVDTYDRVKTMYTDSWGELYQYFDVPSRLNDGDDDEDVHGGDYYVYATYAGSKYIRAIADFTIIAGEITLSPDEGTVGTEVKITGTDFGDNEDITVKYDGSSVAIERGDGDTSSSGGFTSYILIPPSTAGDHTIKVIDDPGSEAEATFTVEPEITIAPTSGGAGTMVTVDGSGFRGSDDVTITFIGVQVTTAETNSKGNFTANFDVPVSAPATYDVVAKDGAGNSDKAGFSIDISADISPVTSETSPGHIGTELTISGTGFKVGGSVTEKYDNTQVATKTADSNGAFSATFTVPVSEGGEHIIIVTDGANTKQFIFVMESKAPPIPPPLKPEMGIKAESETYFDWQDVTDPSGVTYNLQIASKEDFASIVLSKPGLTESEYTLTEEEKLKSVSKDEPYYWRVKAIDGASNESGWSGAGSFHVGFSGLPQWVIYTLLGIGALILGGVGFWAGRKTASQ